MTQFYRYRVKLTEGGSQVEIEAFDPDGNTINEPGGDVNLKQVPDEIERLAGKVRRGSARPKDLEALGEALFESLLPPAVATNLRDLLPKVVQEDALLRVELDLNEDSLPEIAALPWELLRAPQTSRRAVDNLGTHAKVVLSRTRPTWNQTNPITLDERLLIQLVVSAPTDEGSVEFEDVWRALQDLAEAHPNQVAPPLEILHQPNIGSLEKVLEDHRPHILHFIGHGKLGRIRGIEFGELALVDKQGRADYRMDEEIAEIFQVHTPEVVFLQACESGAEGRQEAFVGVASQLVQRNIPVVVAMQYALSNEAATCFAQEFYNRLGTFAPVDEAVQRGRRALSRDFKDTRDFAAPVLFMLVKDGQLFEPSEEIEIPLPKPPSDELAQNADLLSDLAVDLPHPIACAYAEFSKAAQDTEQFAALDGLINNIVKYFTAIGLSYYWQDKPDKKQWVNWTSTLAQNQLQTSLHVFTEIAQHYAGDSVYLSPLLFEPFSTPIKSGSAIHQASQILQELQEANQHAKSENITPQSFLSFLLEYRETHWERNASKPNPAIIERLLPVLVPAIQQLLAIYQPLFGYSLRYIEHINRESNSWAYYGVEFFAVEGNPVEREASLPGELPKDSTIRERRLYLCNPDGQPLLNLHPFLIQRLSKLYFLEQAADRWYVHCASAERYKPPKTKTSYFVGESRWVDDPSDLNDTRMRIEQANELVEKDEDSERFETMPFSTLLTHFSIEGREALEIALGESLRIGRFWVGIEFLLMGLSKQSNKLFTRLLYDMQLHPGQLRGILRGIAGVITKQEWQAQDAKELGAQHLSTLKEADPGSARQAIITEQTPDPIITPRLYTLLRLAAKTSRNKQIDHSHLLLTLFDHDQAIIMQIFYSIVHEMGWSRDQIKSNLAALAKADDGGPPLGPGLPQVRQPRPLDRSKGSDGSVLTELGRDLTKAAREGLLHPAEGESARQALTQIGRVLRQREANNPLLIGDPGVGKTAIVEGFAWRLAGTDRKLAPGLDKLQVIELSANNLTAGTKYRGAMEERIQKLLSEVKSAKGQMVVFIDEIHSLLEGSSTDGLANAIKPALARGEFPCIGATTVAEYRQYIEKDGALARRFTPIWLEEPSLDEANDIVNRVASGHLAEFHNVVFAPPAIEAAVRLSNRYIIDQRLPGKAIKLLDEAASGRIIGGSLSGDPNDMTAVGLATVTEDDVLQVVVRRTNIPITQLGKTDTDRLNELEAKLKTRIIGQDEAVRQVTNHVKRAGANLTDPRRPQGVFLLAGPTGIGKTELALALTAALFDQKDAVLRLDMSEFMEKHQVARLTGSPPGYVGYDDEGQLTGRLRRQPYCVVLLDEMEKAHQDVQHLFLQLFDSGRLTDARGRLADGRQAFFVMTTNLGAVAALEAHNDPTAYQQKLNDAIYTHFSREFINRIDRIICFSPLDVNALLAIFDRELEPFRQQLAREHGIEIEVPEVRKQQIVGHIANQKLGARPLRRFIEDKIIGPIVDKLLAGELSPGPYQVSLPLLEEPRQVQPDEGAPLAFKPDQLEQGAKPNIGQPPSPPPSQPGRPETPEAGLPHHERIPDAEQDEFDSYFLDLAKRLADQNIAIEIEPIAKFWLCAPDKADQKPREGRSIHQAFDDLIDEPLANKLESGEYRTGDWIKIDINPQNSSIEIKKV